MQMVGESATPVERVGEGAVEWVAPGPGTWELDTTHFGPLTSRFMRDVMAVAVEDGIGTAFDMIGAPLATMQAAFVNGQCYFRMVPLIGGDRDRRPPPAPVLWLATRLHPTFRRRARRSVEAVDGRIWLSEHRRWQDEWRPALVEANRRLGRIDPAALDDVGLADHLDAIAAHVHQAAALHFRLHASDLGPIGLLLIECARLGLDRGVAMSALAGASEATSAPAVALTAIRAELDRIGCIPVSLDDIRAAGPHAAELLDRYLDDYGNRLTTGYDIRDLTLGELPDVVLASILDPRDVDVADAARRGDDARDALLDAAPASERTRLVELIDDARLLYGLRDENGPLTSQWPGGVARLAVLEAARRLGACGRLADPEHVFDASAAELTTMLRGAGGPTADELAGRCDERRSWVGLTPRAVLGAPAAPPPIHVLPGRMRQMMEAVITVTTMLDGDVDAIESGARRTATELRGTGIGSHSVVGVARVVAGADDALDRVEPGDVIVARLTVPTFNSVLAMAGGVVTENGGLLCHTAVIARELGLPAVVGVAAALHLIPDGATVEVDPVAGVVRVIDG